MTTIMASDDLLGLLELSDDSVEDVTEIRPRKSKVRKKHKKTNQSVIHSDKSKLSNKSKQKKQRKPVSPHTSSKDIKIKLRKNSKKIKENSKRTNHSPNPSHKQNKKRNSVSNKLKRQSSQSHSQKKPKTTNPRRKSKRIQTETETNPKPNSKLRRKSKRIETDTTHSHSLKDKRRKSKRIETDTTHSHSLKDKRRKSKRIDATTPHIHKRKSVKINSSKENRRKSKRIDPQNRHRNSTENRRKSKRIDPESAIANMNRNMDAMGNRRKSKRIIDNHIPKSYTKGESKHAKTVHKSNNLQIAFHDRPRSKSPMTMNVNAIFHMSEERPRSKSPMTITLSPRQSQSQTSTYFTVMEMEETEREEMKSICTKQPNISANNLSNSDIYGIYKKIKTQKWTIHSKLEIFSVSQKFWNRGKVIKITQDCNGEYLTVVYNDKQKSLLREDKHLRPIQIDLSDHKTKQKTILFIEKYENHIQSWKKSQFYIGQKCEIKDPKYGWCWCEIVEIFKDVKGEFITIDYKVYDVTSNEAKYKHYHIPIHFKALKQTLPPNICNVLHNKWSALSKACREYPIKSTNDHISARNVELTSIGDVYKRYNISSAQQMPDMLCKLIESQNVRVYPILVIDLENTLIPARLIRSIKKKNNIKDTRELFMNFDVWTYDTDYKYLKELQRLMHKTAALMNTLIHNFKGNIVIYSENGYETWDNLMNCLPVTSGGDYWRDIYKKHMSSSEESALSISVFACKDVFMEQCRSEISDFDDLIAAKQLVLEQYFKHVQMGFEYERLKNDNYYVPVVFGIGDDKSDQIAVSQAVNGVFKNFYRLVNFELIQNKQKISDHSLSNNVLRESLLNTMNHKYIQQFLSDNNNHSFIKDTWHGLFGGDMEFMHQLEKI